LLGPLVQGILQPLPFGAVPQHLGQAPQSALLVPQGRGHAVAPKACAALTHQPAVVIRPTRLGCRLQLFLRLSLVNVFGGEKAGEMLADDLSLRVAEDALGPGVPSGDPPVGVEEEDGVVGHALHQQAVLFFGPAQGTLKRLVAGRVAGRVVRGTLVHGSSPSTVATFRFSPAICSLVRVAPARGSVGLQSETQARVPDTPKAHRSLPEMQASINKAANAMPDTGHNENIRAEREEVFFGASCLVNKTISGRHQPKRSTFRFG